MVHLGWVAQWDKSVGSSCPRQALFTLHKQRDYSEKGLCAANKQGYPHTPISTQAHSHIQNSYFHMHTCMYTQIYVNILEHKIRRANSCIQRCSPKHKVNIMKTPIQLTRNITTQWRHLSPLHQLMSPRLLGCYNRVAISRGKRRGAYETREKNRQWGKGASRRHREGNDIHIF